MYVHGPKYSTIISICMLLTFKKERFLLFHVEVDITLTNVDTFAF